LQRFPQAFKTNVKRLISVGTIPILLVATSIINQSSLERAYFDEGVNSGDPRCNPNDALFDQALADKIQASRERRVNEYVEEAKSGIRPRPQIVGEMGLGTIMGAQSPPVHDGLNAILNGMIIGAWTTVETLASDLWKVALNVHPVKLAAISGDWHKPAKQDLDELIEENEGEQDAKTVSLQELQRAGYDLSKTMGNVHRYRFKWGVLEGIRKAYGAAFSNHFADIKAAIEHPSLDALAAARNVLVHKAGTVDAQFPAKHKGWPDFGSAVAGEQLVITGPIVEKLLAESLSSASRLLMGVDAWLQNN
jgi:hypothetical protein